MNLQILLEPNRPSIFAFCVHPRKTKRRIMLIHDHRRAQRPIKRVLRILHVTKEIGKMHDAGHVGLGKLHAPRQLELKSHARRFSRTPRTSSSSFSSAKGRISAWDALSEQNFQRPRSDQNAVPAKSTA